MIVSASRRTDIPSFYADWFVNRIKAGYCLTQNPFNAAQIRRVSLLPEYVDGIVLWTKNAAPLLPKIFALDPYQYYFHYTITPYHTDIECGLASKSGIVIPAFWEMATRIGAERMIWRYDPIIITDKYDEEYHVRAFSRLCELLMWSTKKCVISFAIAYKSVAGNLLEIGHQEIELQDKLRLAKELMTIANTHGITLCSCCELPELYQLGAQPISCVDADLFGVSVPRDKNQRKGCNCATSVDIGAYNSCMNGCRYCYANHVQAKVKENFARHDVMGEMLIQ